MDFSWRPVSTFKWQVFINNFVHGDLHPGNLLVGRQADSEELCLVILDAGIVCELDEIDRKNFVDLFYAIVVGDGKLAGRLMIERVRRDYVTSDDALCWTFRTEMKLAGVLTKRSRNSGHLLPHILTSYGVDCYPLSR